MGPHGVAIAAIARWAQAQVVQKRNKTDGNGRSWQNSKRLEFIVIYCDIHGIDHYDIYIYTHMIYVAHGCSWALGGSVLLDGLDLQFSGDQTELLPGQMRLRAWAFGMACLSYWKH